MRLLIQRVSSASVIVAKRYISQIGRGMLVFVGISEKDTKNTLLKAKEKILKLRIFEDDNQKMNLSLRDLKKNNIMPQLLVISQFTLYADCYSGNKPSFIEAAKPLVAKKIFDEFLQLLNTEIATQTGVFGEYMTVQITNEGPATFYLEIL